VLGKAELLKRTARDEQARRVGGSVVCQADRCRQAELDKLMGVGGRENLVADNLRRDDLGDDVLVGE